MSERVARDDQERWNRCRLATWRQWRSMLLLVFWCVLVAFVALLSSTNPSCAVVVVVDGRSGGAGEFGCLYLV